MKQFWVFVKKEILHILRDKQTLFVLIGMPVAQILIFGFALSNEVKNSNIAILDQSKDQATEQLTHRIESSRYFDIKEYLYSSDQIEACFRKGDVRMVIVFPNNFESNLQLMHYST